jgi:ubiquinone/menaquinone biosynthesis C-methylase UbiE
MKKSLLDGRTEFPLATGRRALEIYGVQNRSDYKSTWEALAPTERDARMYVAGHTDTDEWDRSARVTQSVLSEYVGLNPTDIILEIGCGMGRVGKVLAPGCARWIGTDISSGMLDCARHQLAGFENIELVELKDVGLEPIADASIDLVYCTVVFMHLLEWDRYRYVEEAKRVLKPGGRCYFDNVDITTDHGWKVFLESAHFPRNERPPHLSMTSSGDELETYGTRAGFADVAIHRWGGAWVALTGRKPDGV